MNIINKSWKQSWQSEVLASNNFRATKSPWGSGALKGVSWQTWADLGERGRKHLFMDETNLFVNDYLWVFDFLFSLKKKHLQGLWMTDSWKMWAMLCSVNDPKRPREDGGSLAFFRVDHWIGTGPPWTHSSAQVVADAVYIVFPKKWRSPRMTTFWDSDFICLCSNSWLVRWVALCDSPTDIGFSRWHWLFACVKSMTRSTVKSRTPEVDGSQFSIVFPTICQILWMVAKSCTTWLENLFE